MKILNKILAGTAALALLSSSTLAVSYINPTIGGSLRLIPVPRIERYDRVLVSTDLTNFTESVYVGDFRLTRENNNNASFVVYASNASSAPRNNRFTINTTVSDIIAAKQMYIRINQVLEDGITSQIYEGNLADLAYQNYLPMVEVYNNKVTKLEINAYASTNLKKELYTTFELSISPTNTPPISAPIM